MLTRIHPPGGAEDDSGLDTAPGPAPAPGSAPAPGPATTQPAPPPEPPAEHFLGNLRLRRYRPLFSGPAVERVPELRFQRPEAEVELAYEDADQRRIATGDTVTIRSNGTSVALRARVGRGLPAGTIRIADEHAGDLHRDVEVVKAS